ncbi:MAG: ABC transporter substrate-binding protein [Deinococcota bacterium]
MILRIKLTALIFMMLLSFSYAQTCVTHELGETCVDSVPERIVVLEYSFADHLGSLGVAPVGYALDDMPTYLNPFTADVGAEVVGTRREPSLEAITALNPDFIIGDLRRHEAIYDQLSAIAPTVIFNSLRGSYEDQLEAFNAIAGLLGKEAEANDILEDYQASFDSTRTATNPEAGDFVIGVLWSGGFTAHSDQSFMGSFVESLGRDNALTPQDGETQYLVDLEGLASINPSSIVIMCGEADQGILDEWQANPLWQAFDAVQNDRVYVFNRNLWSKGRGVMAFEAILEDSVDSGLLAEAPSTALVCQ